MFLSIVSPLKMVSARYPHASRWEFLSRNDFAVLLIFQILSSQNDRRLFRIKVQLSNQTTGEAATCYSEPIHAISKKSRKTVPKPKSEPRVMARTSTVPPESMGDLSHLFAKMYSKLQQIQDAVCAQNPPPSTSGGLKRLRQHGADPIEAFVNAFRSLGASQSQRSNNLKEILRNHPEIREEIQSTSCDVTEDELTIGDMVNSVPPFKTDSLDALALPTWVADW